MAQAAEARELAIALAAFAPGLVGYGVTANLSRVLYADGRSRASAAAVSGGWLLVIIADLLIVPLVPRSQVVPWLAAATTIGLTGSGLTLLLLVRRYRGPRALRGWARAAAAGLAGALAGTAAGLGVAMGVPVSGFLPERGRHRAGRRRCARGLPDRRGHGRRGGPARRPAPRGRRAGPSVTQPAAGQRVKVAFVLGTSAGGTGRHVAMLAAGCTARGVRAEVFGPPQADRDFGFAAAARGGVGFTPVSIGERPRVPGDLRTITRLRRLLRAGGPMWCMPTACGPGRSPR